MTVELEDILLEVDEETRSPLALDDARSRPWRVVLYFDAVLSTAAGFAEASELMFRRAGRLLQLGEVEIVLADPHPRPFLAPTADEAVLREALELMEQEAIAVGELAWLRQRFEQDPTSELPAGDAARQELGLVRQQLGGLRRWVRAQPRRTPQVLFLVQSGFDRDPGGFYFGGEARNPIATEEIEDLARDLAVHGWTTFPLSLGPRGHGLEKPLDVLAALAEPTGGAALRRAADLKRTLGAMEIHHRLRFESSSESIMSVSVNSARPEVVLRAPVWIGVPSPVPDPAFDGGAQTKVSRQGNSLTGRPIIRLVPPHGDEISGRVRLQALTTTSAARRADFLVDGHHVGTDDSPPFAITLDLGPEAEHHVISVEAFSRSGQRLGHHDLHLNEPSDPFRVAIRNLEHDEASGTIVIEARVGFPDTRRLLDVSFLHNETLLRVLSAPPFRVSARDLDTRPGDYFRVVARLQDGAVREDVRMLDQTGDVDRLDVNLVELYATVSKRGGSAVTDLTAGDFSLWRDGEPLRIERFSRAEGLPIEVGLAIDSSLSMGPIMEATKYAATRFLTDSLSDRDQVFLVEFNSRPRLVQEASRDLEQVVRRFAALRPSGDTTLYDAIAFSTLQFERRPGRKALVVFTDGFDDRSLLDPATCIGAARRLGVPVYIISLDAGERHGVRQRYRLQQIADRTGGRFFFISKLDQLQRTYDEIAAELRGQYLIAWTTDRALSHDELESLEVRVSQPRLVVRSVVGGQNLY